MWLYLRAVKLTYFSLVVDDDAEEDVIHIDFLFRSAYMLPATWEGLHKA